MAGFYLMRPERAKGVPWSFLGAQASSLPTVVDVRITTNQTAKACRQDGPSFAQLSAPRTAPLEEVSPLTEKPTTTLEIRD